MKYTLILIPGHEQPRYITLSAWIWRWVLITGFVFAVVFCSTLYFYSSFLNSFRQRDVLLLENQKLRQDAQSLVGKLASIEDDLKAVEMISHRIYEVTQSDFSSLLKPSRHIPRNIGPLTVEEYKSFKDAEKEESEANLQQDKTSELNEVITSADHVKEISKDEAHKLQTYIKNIQEMKEKSKTIPTVSPVKGWISSLFGLRDNPVTGRHRMHQGIDIAATKGTPIYAPADGVVTLVAKAADYGNYIEVKHGFRIITKFAHIEKSFVKKGQKVRRGEMIALVGDTGRTTGPHLHYEVREDTGKPKNPLNYIR